MWCMNRSVYVKIDYAVGGCNALNVQTKSGLQINSMKRVLMWCLMTHTTKDFKVNATHVVAVSFEILLIRVLMNSQVLN